jgi:hypothetical protein
LLTTQHRLQELNRVSTKNNPPIGTQFLHLSSFAKRKTVNDEVATNFLNTNAMHIQVINYQKTFNLGNYSSERIGVEIAINAGENAKEALETAKKLVEEFHTENINQSQEPKPVYEETVQVIKTQSPKTITEKTKVFIDACKTPEELKAWELMVYSYPELEEYYDKKLKSLLKK